MSVNVSTSAGTRKLEQRTGVGLPLQVALVAVIVVLVDQLSKALVRSNLAPCDGSIASTCHHIRVGAAWIVNVGHTMGVSAATLPAAALSMVFVPVCGGRLAVRADTGWRLPVALGLMAGGALGNLVDRLAFGVVTDFLSPGRYLTFNLADVAVIAGTVMTIRLLLRAARTRVLTAS